MIRLRRNKNELLSLTGAVYLFVAYLTAFSLEVLFLVDLARQSQANEQLVATPGSNSPEHNDPGGEQAPANSISSSALDARLSFEAMHAHITISCLAIAILYFVVFITSLILIVALILRSTFMLLVWMCAMTTLYLPEFGLVVYVSVYSWGIETRNGQTESMFYLFRAILNVIFIVRTYKLYKQWKYEKNFFRLKSSLSSSGPSGLSTISGLGSTSAGVATSGRSFAAYDSPYLIGDSLTTTINPVFSSSTLNLNRYDHVRGFYPRDSPTSNSINASIFSSSDYVSDYNHLSSASNQQQHISSTQMTKRDDPSRQLQHQRHSSIYHSGNRASPSRSGQNKSYLDDYEFAKRKQPLHQPTGRFYLGGSELVSRYDKFHSGPQGPRATNGANRIARNSSMLSINDNFPYYEMDIDYKTLDQRRDHYHNHNNHQKTAEERRSRQNSPLSPSRDDLCYTTQSLDRRQLKEFGLATDQVVLRPLGHQPFDYLRRPGSITNLDQVDTPQGYQYDQY